MKTLLLAAGTIAATGIAAQQAPPEAAPIARFEVASVKRNTSGNTFMAFNAQPERLFLSQQLGRPVRDETGIDGAYDLTLTFMPDSTGRGMPIGPPPPGAPELRSIPTPRRSSPRCRSSLA